MNVKKLTAEILKEDSSSMMHELLQGDGSPILVQLLKEIRKFQDEMSALGKQYRTGKETAGLGAHSFTDAVHRAWEPLHSTFSRIDQQVKSLKGE